MSSVSPYHSRAACLSLVVTAAAFAGMVISAHAQTRPGDKPAPATKTYNKVGAFNYGNQPALLPGTLMDQVTRYLAGRYDLAIAGNSPRPYNTRTSAVAYQDMAAIYSYEMPDLFDIAEKRNFVAEDMLLHMNVNYTFNDSRYAWSEMQRFDAFERIDGQHFVNGVYSQSGTGPMIDQTDAIWDKSQSTDTPVADKIYVGYSEPFDEINVELRAPSGTSVSWQYWNGITWNPLTLRSDGTNGLTASGKVLFSPPSSWVQSSVVTGKRKKWWVRVVTTGSGTSPVIAAMYGDNWSVPGQYLTWRGWDNTSSNRMNIGLGNLEYNPNPPANATARFRYQARALGLWANNLFFLNPTNIQNGKRTASQFIVDRMIPILQAYGYNGLFLDDALATPNDGALISPAGGWQAASEVAGIDYYSHLKGAVADVRDQLHALVPGSIVGINSSIWDQVANADFGIVELANEVHKGGTYYIDKQWPTSWNSLTYDQLLPVNNPTGVKGMFCTWDTQGSDFIWNGQYMTWDRGNRSPITALAAYYVVANENTIFNYNTSGWRYDNAEDFQYVNEVPDFTTTGSLQVDTSSSTKVIYGNLTAFPSGPTSAAPILVKIGHTGEYLPVWKVSDNQLATTDGINFQYAAGTGIYLIRTGHLAVDTLPPVEQVVKYAYYFPALDVDIGLPDVNGYNGGARNLAWKTGAESGTGYGIQRRDFQRAIVLHATGSYDSVGSMYNTYGNSIDLGGTYYALKSDGTTGPGMTSIRLRTGEGAILLKAPLTLSGAASSLSGLTLSAASISGGSTLMGTVTLNAPAPTGRASVTLSASNAVVAVPPSVVIAAGTTSSTFALTSTTVNASTSVTISASYSGLTQAAAVTVTPVSTGPVPSLSAAPSTVTGGAAATGTVTLSSPAPSGGTTVVLSSANPAVTLPANITISAGNTTATFAITTTSVTATTPVVLSATSGGTTNTTTLTVTPAGSGLLSLVINPATSVGGTSIAGTVTLTAPAPSTGASIALTSNNVAVVVPPTVTIPAGSSTYTFSVTTMAVTTSTSVVISASYAGTSQTFTMTVTPPTLTLSSLTVGPGSVAAGSSSTGTVTLSGPAPANGVAISLASSNVSAATVPALVTVPAGSTTATFPVVTKTVVSNTSVTISAMYNGTTRTSTLNVRK